MTTERLPTLMIAHGGGPCFFMSPTDPQPPGIWDGLGAHLRGLAGEIGVRPRAILVVSAHWETPTPTLHEASEHTLLFDYYNFPEHTYRLTWPAPGAPDVAARARSLLAAASISSAGEMSRGLDHGVFVPFKLIYPDADIPVTQLSLTGDLSPDRQMRIGEALAPLRDEGVLIVGSGMTYHNLREGPTPRAMAASIDFDDWLFETMTGSAQRLEAGLLAWESAPGARMAHPREEHLLPLMVAAGAAAGDPATRIYSERLGGHMALSGYRFG